MKVLLIAVFLLLNQLMLFADAFVPLASSCKGIQQKMSHLASVDQREALICNLPPVDRSSLSRLEAEFRDLLEGILYTPREIEAVPYAKLRTVLTGIAASYSDPALYRAFEVLFEDYAPLRVAGRLVYGRVTGIVESATTERDSQTQQILETTSLSTETIHNSWMTFGDFVRGKEFTLKQCQVSLVPRLNHIEEGIDVDDLSVAIFKGNSKSATFADLVIGLDEVLDLSAMPTDDVNDILDFNQYPSSESIRKQENRDKFNQKYDEMLTKFDGWKQYVPSGEGRKLDVLRGCFVGSENPKVVEALRIIYCEYPALRVCGDWIFKIVSTLISASRK